jgi:ATP-dependent DNA ligase
LHFEQFAQDMKRIREQGSHRRKVKDLARLLKQLDASELPAAIYLCQGRLAVTYRPRQKEYIRMSQKQVSSAIQHRPRRPPVTSTSIQDEPRLDLATDAPLDSLSSFYNTLHVSMSSLNAWLSRQHPMPAWLAELSRQMTDREAECLSHILTGPPLKDGIIISALADFMPSAIGVNMALEEVYKHTVPDLGVVVTMMLKEPKQRRYGVLIKMAPQPGIPLKPQEIDRWDSVEDAWRAMGCCYVQPKYDGWQIQIHKEGDEIRLFDRKLEERTSQLPDVVEACRNQIPAESAMLDSEVVGYDPAAGRILPWEQTLSATAHRVFVFDVILLDGQDWRKKEYYKRRQILAQLLPEGDTQILSAVPEEFVDSQKHLEELYGRWSAHRDSEGVIIIKPAGRYLSGRVTKEKAKLKAYVSLDLVVLGYRVSKKGIPSYFLGLWDGTGSELIPVGWAEGAIIPPDVRKELWKRCQALRATTKPAEVANDLAPRVWVYPQAVVEVTVAGKTRDGRYKHAGYRLYRKKDLRIRDDLGLEDVDNLQEFLRFPVPPGEGDPRGQTTGNSKHRISGSTTSGKRTMHEVFSAYRAVPYTSDSMYDSSRYATETLPATQERQEFLADSGIGRISPSNAEPKQLALFPVSDESPKNSEQQLGQPADMRGRSISTQDDGWKQLAFLPMSDEPDRSNDQR